MCSDGRDRRPLLVTVRYAVNETYRRLRANRIMSGATSFAVCLSKYCTFSAVPTECAERNLWRTHHRLYFNYQTSLSACLLHLPLSTSHLPFLSFYWLSSATSSLYLSKQFSVSEETEAFPPSQSLKDTGSYSDYHEQSVHCCLSHDLGT